MGEIDVKALRNQLGLSQEQFAEMIGVHWRTVQNWEKGKEISKASTYNKLCEIRDSIGTTISGNAFGDGSLVNNIDMREVAVPDIQAQLESLKHENEELKEQLKAEQQRSADYWSLIKTLQKKL